MDEQNQNPTPMETGPNYQYAGFWIRVAASLIDGLVFIPIVALSFANMLYFKNVFILLAIAIPGLFYKPFMESKYGATLGKMACGIKVISADGDKLELGQAYLRFVPFLVSTLVSLLLSVTLYLDPAFATATFMEIGQIQQANPINTVNSIISMFVLIDCVVAAFQSEKRAIHDMMCNSYCVYK